MYFSDFGFYTKYCNNMDNIKSVENSMSSLEIELQNLRERNNELVKKVQYWKVTAAQRDNEKLDLMKENNDLRLKLSRLRSGGAAHARKLDAEIQSASKQALSHLVQASTAVTKTVELVKAYMQEKQEMEIAPPRWSSISNTPSSEKVHRVLPMLIGGQSIQPVVSLSRTIVNMNNLRTNRSPNNNQNRNFSERGALPMHMLQDLYIPLTRIDANGLPVNSIDVEPDADDTGGLNNSTEDLGLDDSAEQSLQELQSVSDTEQIDDTQRLDVVDEALEPEDEEALSPKTANENPLEGPSWMLDRPNQVRKTKSQTNLEPDSTTECDERRDSSTAGASRGAGGRRRSVDVCDNIELVCGGRLFMREHDRLPPPPVSSGLATASEFSPTVRRRKRTCSPAVPTTPSTPRSPQVPHARRSSNDGRILKVLVPKLQLEEDVSPPKRRTSENHSPGRGSPTRLGRDKAALRRHSRDNSPLKKQIRGESPSVPLPRDRQLLSFDAPSPNGATTSHVIISEPTTDVEGRGTDGPASARRPSTGSSLAGADSDSGSDVAPVGRTRRPRKAVTYKEKPLNRKMRR